MGDTCQHDHADGPPGKAEVERALAAAGERLTAEGERLTPARLRVLGLLLAAGEPVKAYDLIARFGEDGQPLGRPRPRSGLPDLRLLRGHRGGVVAGRRRPGPGRRRGGLRH